MIILIVVDVTILVCCLALLWNSKDGVPWGHTAILE